MVNLSHLKPIRVLVAGDFMLDRYTFGSVGRISPEAPVPVLKITDQKSLPGGAGNVALNLAALDAHVHVLGRIGPDNCGDLLKSLLEAENINTDYLITEEDFSTPVKNRIVGSSQQMLRIDQEQTHDLPEAYLSALKFPDVDLIAISDYNKGFLTKSLLKALIAHGQKLGVPVLVDPKGSDFSKYRGVTLIKPNLKEALSAANAADLEQAAQSLLKQTKVEHLLITRSKDGMSLFDGQATHTHFPVRSKEVQDVTGAGDTVLAALSLALANQLSIESAVHLANIAAGISIEKLGCARITLAEIAERILELDSTSKVYDEHTLYTLTKALTNKPFTIVGIDSADHLSLATFGMLKKLKTANQKLIVYIRDKKPPSDFVSLLSSLHEVDFVVIKSDSLSHLCDELHPSSAYLFDGGTLSLLESTSALIS
ncbi:MAG: bifunctional hydroxymethylpyrimidine kinase/phosphomethylpyrimidine kinase [Chlamydiia bacterium]|nr:bifunctional hydroxymethylpyrimidine kinase/phosphomethylpyrimidine kinase [Chlamydiia bacterium]